MHRQMMHLDCIKTFKSSRVNVFANVLMICCLCPLSYTHSKKVRSEKVTPLRTAVLKDKGVTAGFLPTLD